MRKKVSYREKMILKHEKNVENILKAGNYVKNKKLAEDYFDKREKTEICPDTIYLEASDIDGSVYRKMIPCGREICAVCGKRNSIAHRIRVARCREKVDSMSSLGYLVFTIPAELREIFKNTINLGDFSVFIKNLLKENGYKRGIMRWHWSGEYIGYAPHLNVLVDSGYLDKSEFEKKIGGIKKMVLEYFNKNYCDDKFYEKINLKYNYTSQKGKKIHKLKYIMRGTMINIGDDMYSVYFKLHNYRNTRYWGKWIKKTDKSRNKGILEELNEKLRWVYKGKFSAVYQNTLETFCYLGEGIFKYNSTSFLQKKLDKL